MGLISAFVKLFFVFLGIAVTYFVGGHWLNILTTQLAQLTLLTLFLAIIEPIGLIFFWVFITGVLAAD